MMYTTVFLCISLIASALVTGFHLDDLSCQGRCGVEFNRNVSCHCNSQCLNYNDCCRDYTTRCGGDADQRCKDFSALTQELWTSDTDRLSSTDVTLNYQAQLPDFGNIQDNSSQKLFTYVNESKLASPVFTTFLALLDNYDPVKNDPEVVTPQETAEEEAFFDAVFATSTFKTLYDYLLCQGKVTNQTELRAVLRRVWFDFYPRSGISTVLDTSGFEHVMVGEFKSAGVVNGLHSWLAFYAKENKTEEPNINYYGHTCEVHTNIACAAYDWDGHKKRLSSFFLNSSPAYDLAIYSLCYIMRPGTCRVVIGDGEEKTIQTYSKDGHIATAFVKV